jgi:hypothetical protein
LPSNGFIHPPPFINGNKSNNQKNYSGILVRKAGDDIFKISIGVLVLMDRLLDIIARLGPARGYNAREVLLCRSAIIIMDLE